MEILVEATTLQDSFKSILNISFFKSIISLTNLLLIC